MNRINGVTGATYRLNLKDKVVVYTASKTGHLGQASLGYEDAEVANAYVRPSAFPWFSTFSAFLAYRKAGTILLCEKFPSTLNLHKQD